MVAKAALLSAAVRRRAPKAVLQERAKDRCKHGQPLHRPQAHAQAGERVSLPVCVPDYANALNARHAHADTRVSGSATAFAKAEKWLVYRLCKRVHAEDRETNAERRAPQQEHELPPVERRFWRRTHGHIRMR